MNMLQAYGLAQPGQQQPFCGCGEGQCPDQGQVVCKLRSFVACCLVQTNYPWDGYLDGSQDTTGVEHQTSGEARP